MSFFDLFRRKAAPTPAPKPASQPRLVSAEEIVEAFARLPKQRPLAPLEWNVAHEHRVPRPMKGVVPEGTTTLAMDSGQAVMAAAYGNASGYGGWDGYSFMGYPLLSELMQVTEFRRPSEILANEMTRKWGKVVSKSNADKAEAIKDLTDETDKFAVRETFTRAFEYDNAFGIGHVFIDVGANEANLKMPLLVNTAGIAQGSLKAFRLVEPMWTYPNQYNARDPLRPDFYRPQTWFVMGKEVSATRMLTFISRPVSQMLLPAYQFGGISLTQLLNPYVSNFLRTRQSVSDITHNFSTMVLKTDMDQMTTAGGAQQLALRAQIYNTMRDNQGLFVCSMAKEDLVNVAAPLSGLKELQTAAEEQMLFPSGIPIVKAFGSTPGGLNSSTDNEVRTFYDSCSSVQERIGTPNMDKVLAILQMNRWSKIDPDLGWKWNPLWELNETELAQVRKIDAETDAAYVDHDILAPLEVRKTIAGSEDSRYSSIEVDVLPPPMPDPAAEGDPGAEGSGPEGQGGLKDFGLRDEVGLGPSLKPAPAIERDDRSPSPRDDRSRGRELERSRGR